MSQVIDGQLTIHEETLSLLECVQQDYVIALKPLVKYLQRVAKATAPSDVESARVEPLGMSPWDWICSKNRKLMHAAGQEGMANTIMTMLRGAEVWAKDHGTTLEYVDVARSTWTPDGRLIIEFKQGTDA